MTLFIHWNTFLFQRNSAEKVRRFSGWKESRVAESSTISTLFRSSLFVSCRTPFHQVFPLSRSQWNTSSNLPISSSGWQSSTTRASPRSWNELDRPRKLSVQRMNSWMLISSWSPNYSKLQNLIYGKGRSPRQNFSTWRRFYPPWSWNWGRGTYPSSWRLWSQEFLRTLKIITSSCSVASRNWNENCVDK